MTILSEALSAMNKATPGPWIAKLCLGGSYVIDNTLPENKGLVRNIAEVSGHLSTPKDAALIAAAPDMAAWIKKALPYIEGVKEGMEAPLMVQPEKYDELCALLVEAKGEGK